jgi:hypothetical protein
MPHPGRMACAGAPPRRGRLPHTSMFPCTRVPIPCRKMAPVPVRTLPLAPNRRNRL